MVQPTASRPLDDHDAPDDARCFHAPPCTLGAAVERPPAAKAAPPALLLPAELALEADALPYNILSRLLRERGG